VSGEWAKVSPREQEIVARFLDAIPVKVATLARELGLEVKSATLRPRISGQLQRSETSSSGFRIRVNRHEAPARQRFTIAHEIAHYLLHREDIGDGIEDSILYRSTLSDAREAEANRLAADILMPKKFIRNELKDFGGPVNQEIAQTLAEKFEVSEAAMNIRLGL
jgi:hypothetical protein